MASLQETFAQRQNESQSKINDLYNKQYQTTAAGLKADYDQNMSDAKAALGKIAPQYQTQANALARQYETQRRNANVSAMNSGLASGTQQQQQLALNQKWLENYGNLRGQEAEATTNAQNNIAKLTTNYNNALVQARADSDNKKAAALIEDQNKQRDWYDQQAKTLAGYGNFDAYASIYGQQQADAMKKVWQAQNPDLAYNTGAITAERYKEMTGQYPAGYTPPNSGGGGSTYDPVWESIWWATQTGR